MITAEELAKMLNGKENISKDLIQLAKENDLVIVYGASDDLLEFDGAIYDEVGAFNGTTAYLMNGKVIQDCDDACDHCDVEMTKEKAKKIYARWGIDDYDWIIETDDKDGIYAYAFDIYEDSKTRCRGLTFNVKETYSEN